ncbi:uncharacterized protein LOC109834705 [Asparagus officinalis]|uniref:uncharacterized protein LOC109834705 n=1 Tax=Asparagus officinalis TaxID=4686 RepID=UPI00098E18B1|nr:uncharacterized protein LOC109834705 [Asparagus officinalis]
MTAIHGDEGEGDSWVNFWVRGVGCLSEFVFGVVLGMLMGPRCIGMALDSSETRPWWLEGGTVQGREESSSLPRYVLRGIKSWRKKKFDSEIDISCLRKILTEFFGCHSCNGHNGIGPNGLFVSLLLTGQALRIAICHCSICHCGHATGGSIAKLSRDLDFCTSEVGMILYKIPNAAYKGYAT